MAQGFTNFYESTLSGPISATDLVIPINTPPSVTEGWLLLDYDVPSKREFIYFTSKTGSNVTVPSLAVGRGRDGTTAIAHTQNAKVRMNVSAGMLKDIVDGIAIVDGAVTASKIDFSSFAILYGGSTLSAGTNTKTFTPTSTGLLQVTAQARRNSGTAADMILTISATGVSDPKTTPGLGYGSVDGHTSTVYLGKVTAGVSVTITITITGGIAANAGYTFQVTPGVATLI